jgi:hypothetical protein
MGIMTVVALAKSVPAEAPVGAKSDAAASKAAKRLMAKAESNVVKREKMWCISNLN